ncbi:putative transporter [Agromyces luteolus]|uniref:Amino acid permease n=1 Tax=Agromyces luteolus TaxID=88373 RepID=A0A7C9LSW7_9MICO|nr:APC family permease [Agromyces luteolus]MUN07136.1 amino acid permease [Agromyces luteolus]GLK29432.1 putative transporter [Agromyces luteolus]
MTASPPPHDRLARRLGLRGAVAIGLAAMIGAGVFAVWAPAAQAAGGWLLAGLAIAALVAFANAGSTAQLAVRYPESGGAYRYGRERLGAWPGFLAGWGFVIGKTASCAAMALTAAAYLVPPAWSKPVAIAAVVVLVGVNVLGVTRTARVASVIVSAVLAVLVVVVAAGFAAIAGVGWDAGAAGPEAALRSADAAPGALGVYGVLQAAALIFFAFAGYARIATLGEEVREPRRTIPRAIGAAFAIVVVVYALVGTAAVGALGTDALAASVAPLVDVVAVAGWLWAEPVVRIAAGVAALGSLLALVAGVGRTSLAMARDGELPRPLTAVHPRFGVPHVAEIATGVAVIVLLLAADLRGAIGFSSFGVLLYYLVANASAITQPASERLVPRWLSWFGAIGCVVLVVTLPVASIVAGAAVFAVGAAVRGIRLAVAARRT